MQYQEHVRATQSNFRKTLSAVAQNPTDDPWKQGFLLALGSEEETLYPSLRGAGGALGYFADRKARWWSSPKTGDSGLPGPTRNMTSSQVACVNLLLPIKDRPD